MSTLTTNYQLLAEKYLGSSYGDLYVRLYAKYSEQETANNRSKVQYQSRAYFTGNYIYDQSGAGNVSGTSASTVSGSCPQPTKGETIIATTEGWVSHNDEGKGSISASAYLNFPNWGWSATASADATLPTIPRATACPNLDGYIESSAPISLNPASTSFKHRLYYSYNGKTGYYPSSSGFFANTGSLSLDTSFYSYTPGSSGTGSITLYTYDSSGNLIGSKTGSITVRCDADKCRPSVSATIVDTNEKTKALTGNNSKLVKGFSNAQVTYTISAKNGASIKSKTINGKTLGTSPYTISGVSTGTFEIYAIDSRDFPKTEYKYNTLVDYIPLTIDFNAFRPTPTGSTISINFQGNYFNGSFGSVNNELSLSWKYRVKGASSWADGGTFVKDTDYTISGNRFYSIGDRTLSDTLFDYQTNYEIAVYYADKLIDTYAIKPVPKGKPVLSWEDNCVTVNDNLEVTDAIVTKKINGYIWDIETNNTTDTWVPVIANNSIQHREISAFLNSTDNIAQAGTPQSSSFDNVASGQPLNRSGLYSIDIGEWYNLINIRHRNGTGDGGSYGMQIRNNLTSINSKLQIRQQSGGWGSWRTIQEEGISLYNNTSGTAGTVTLSESSGGFNYIEIFFKTNDNIYNSMKVYSPNGKKVCLVATTPFSSSVGYLKSTTLIINETTISVDAYSEVAVPTSGNVSVANANVISIVKVVGYR